MEKQAARHLQYAAQNVGCAGHAHRGGAAEVLSHIAGGQRGNCSREMHDRTVRLQPLVVEFAVEVCVLRIERSWKPAASSESCHRCQHKCYAPHGNARMALQLYAKLCAAYRIHVQ